MDYFVTSDLYEHERAQSRFTEQLLRVDGLNHFASKPPVVQAVLDRLQSLDKEKLFPGVGPTTPIILCAHTNVKYHPAFDEALDAILRQATDAALVVMYNVQDSVSQDTLANRWRQSLAAVFDRIVFVPFPGTTEHAFEKFLSMIAISEVLLDPFPFGNGMTALDAFAVCTPSVTLPAKQSVLRLVDGFYASMGIYDAPVAQNISAYASLVAHFAQNTTANQRLRQRICASNAVLYESERAVGGWEAAIEQLVAAERASAGTGISSDEADLL
eukprot:g2494.t1